MSARVASIWLVGCGNMAGAMLRRWIDAGTVDPARVFVVNRQDRDLPPGVAQGRSFPEGPLPDAVMLGMKPYQIDEIAAAHGARIAGVPLLISILAGVEEATLAARFDAGAIVRALPNLPVAIGKGVVALNSAGADDATRAAVAALMDPLGLVEWVDIAHYDLVTALAGSGPGFTYRFIDALADAGTELGLPADQAQRLAVATVEGSGLLAAASHESPAALAERVASPRGSTREGLNVLDKDGALKSLLRETLAAAERRNAEMAAEARS
jgi:pyrroline-5-carboxylate reductase